MAQAPVLYVEDEENDVLLMRMGFERTGVSHPLVALADGKQAIDYLAGTGPYANRELYPLPCVVLLDLNLPRRSGFEVLQWIRECPQLRSLPVVIVTSSGHECDLDRAYELGATDYFQKTPSLPKLGEMAQNLQDRWLRQAH